MRWQQVQDAVVHHDGKETLDGIRRSKVHWMNNPEYQRQLTPIYKEVTTKVRALNDKYWRYVVDGWQAFQYTEYDAPYQIQNMTFDSTLTVLQRDENLGIVKDYFVEVYAKHIGLVYKESIHLEQDNVDPTWSNPNRGYTYTMKAISYGN